MSLRTTLTFGCMATLTSSTDIDTPSDPYNHSWIFNWLDGTAINQANRSYHNESPLTPAEVETLNLTNGSLEDAFGSAFQPARIKALAIRNTGTVNITVGGTNGIVGSGFTLRPGEVVMKAAPDATAYATSGANTLTLTNASAETSAAYELVIIGASA